MEHILYLGSKSQARQQLLKDAQIPFVLVEQNADESKCEIPASLQESVEKIALYKMEHVVLPEGKEGDTCFVLTADTLTQNNNGSLSGKPKNRFDAIEMIKAARGSARVGTAFCLDRRVLRSGEWTIFKREQGYVDAIYDLDIPDEWIDIYLEKSFSATSSGAIAIEVYGAQFLKAVHGSHSTIVGLPMFEVREALQKIGFFNL